MKLLEVCVDSLASARAAKQGGADRLEFCSALAVGGLTPYADLLRQIKAELDLPVRCLMRPRAGDFLYTRDELELLCRQIETLHSAGADGFVIGALTPEGALDLPAMRMLLDACGFGAAIATKGDGITRDIDVLRCMREHVPVLCKVTVTTDSIEGEQVEDCLIPCTIAVKVSEAPKCPRCWNHDEHIGAPGHHAELCDRCAAVLGA